MIQMIIRFALLVLSIVLVAQLVPGIAVSSWTTALIVALLWAFVITIVRPILGIIALPVTILTLGLFSFVLTALLFWALGSGMVSGFTVAGFLPALLGSILLSVFSTIIGMFIGSDD